jgi:hypothetical protein
MFSGFFTGKEMVILIFHSFDSSDLGGEVGVAFEEIGIVGKGFVDGRELGVEVIEGLG